MNPLAVWRWLAWVAGGFSLVLGGSMLVAHLQAKAADPFHSPELKALKEQLRQSPRDEALKQRIRTLDLHLRHGYFTRLERNQTGGYLLLAGVAALVLAVGRVRSGYKHLPQLASPATPGGPLPAAAGPSRWAVGAVGGAMAGLLLVVSHGVAPVQVPREREAPAAPAAGPDAAPIAELQRNWPCFRGFNSGVASSGTGPAQWDPATGAGIAWKVPSPAGGFNSPIAFGDRVFFTGGPGDALEVFGLSLGNGQIAWRTTVTNVAGTPARLEVPESTGFTAPTMATDGRRVYAMFANGNLAACGLDGRLLWTKAFGLLQNAYGHANSLVTYQDKVIVQLDQGDAEDNLSRLVAVDGRTGQIAWQRPRKVGASWASPLVIEAAGKVQVIVLALPFVTAYDATDGTELWRVDCLNGEVTPSPAFANGILYVVSPSEKLLAIRPDGQGDVTKTHVLWENEEPMPDVTTPAVTSNFVFLVTTGGTLTCVDAKTGKTAWTHELDIECHASPVIAGDRVFVFGQEGEAVVVAATVEFKELFRVAMPDSFHATPAFAADGRMVLRGLTNIWCLQPAGKPK